MTNAKFPMMLDAERAKYVAREIKYEQEIATLRQQLDAAQLLVEQRQEELASCMRANSAKFDTIKNLNAEIATLRNAEVAGLKKQSARRLEGLCKCGIERDQLREQVTLLRGTLVAARAYYEKMFGVCLDSSVITHHPEAIKNFAPAGSINEALAATEPKV